MRRGSDLSLDLFGDRLLLPAAGESNGAEHRHMIRALKKAARGELTARQLNCVRLFYYEGKSVGEVAETLGITAATASKHLKKARKRLGKVMKYFF